MELTLRPLERADFGMLARWLERPAVRYWWNHETGPDDVERDFGPTVDGAEPGEVLVVAQGGTPFGLVQRYRYADYPDYVREVSPLVELPDGAMSTDYLIGEEAYAGRGLGAAMIALVVADTWGPYPEASAFVVPVSAGNKASWRALERAGFRRVAEGDLEPDNPAEPLLHVVYRLDRPG